MKTTGREVIGHCGDDMLVAGSRHPLDVHHVTLAAGEMHRKGEVLEVSEDGKCYILGTAAAAKAAAEVQIAEETQDGETQAADNATDTLIENATVAGYILAEDADARTGDITAAAYSSGSFIRNALIVKEGYSLTDKDERELRIGGIYLSDAMM